MTRTILCAALVTLAASDSCFGAEAAPDAAKTNAVPLIDCGSEKVVVFEGTEPPDSACAIGWTIRPKKAGTPAVDWSLYDPEKPWDFRNRWFPIVSNPAAPYSVIDGVIDLRHKQFIVLPTEDAPYWPHKNHGDLSVNWTLDSKGHRYGLVANYGRFETANLWLLTIDEKAGIQQTDLEPRLSKAVEKVVAAKRPWRHEEFLAWFFIAPSVDSKGAIFRGNEVEIPFHACIPKSFLADETVAGSLTVHLPAGTITKVACTSGRKDPFSDDQELAAADRRLNETYKTLLKRLSPAERETLRKEQREWISERDNQASQETRAYAAESDGAAAFRNKSLRASTQSRNAELKKRLAQTRGE